MGGNDGDVVHKCIYRHLVDIHRIRPMVQFPGTLSKYASGPPAVSRLTLFLMRQNFLFPEIPFWSGGAAASPLSNILTGRPSPVSMLKSESQILDKRSASPSEPHQGTDLGPQLMTLKAYSGSYSSSHRYGKQLLLLC